MKCGLGLILGLLVSFSRADENEGPDHWRQDAKSEFEKVWKLQPNYKKAKNVILMVGDGMGVSTITAARIYKGQTLGMKGEDFKLSFEKFPYHALSKTYNLDYQVPDSAGTAVAMTTGIKVNFGTLGVTGEVKFGTDCSKVTESTKLKTILHHAQEEGMSIGVVTTTSVTHATPAATYARVPHRDWECDEPMKALTGCDHVKDIAYQLIKDNPNINVILGGGRRYFLNQTNSDGSEKGQRLDGRNLINEWKADKSSRNLKYTYVQNKTALENVDVSNTDFLLGLFSLGHMEYDLKRNKDQDPTLQDMVDKAIGILKKNPKGYFLLIEGGRIDHGHHSNNAKLALGEAHAFDDAVEKVTKLTSVEDTLTIVTADHSHVFTIAGYPVRGNNILGLTNIKLEPPKDSLPYTTLGYLNGPAIGRNNLTGVDTTDNDYQFPGCIEMGYETHGGEDVAIFAQGPMAHMFHATHEQSYIGNVMMYSACLGVYKNNCDLPKRTQMDENGNPCSAVQHLSSVLISILAALATLQHVL